MNQKGWMGMVNLMRHAAVGFFLPPSRFTDQMADGAATYLTQLFGPHSSLPASPAELPGYKATVRKFASEAMNIAYVVYPVAGKWVNDEWVPDPLVMTAQMFPPTAGMGYPSDGSIWVADYGNANQVHQINPTTGKIATYPVPATIQGSKAPCIAEAIRAIEVGPTVRRGLPSRVATELEA